MHGNIRYASNSLTQTSKDKTAKHRGREDLNLQRLPIPFKDLSPTNYIHQHPKIRHKTTKQTTETENLL